MYIYSLKIHNSLQMVKKYVYKFTAGVNLYYYLQGDKRKKGWFGFKRVSRKKSASSENGRFVMPPCMLQ